MALDLTALDRVAGATRGLFMYRTADTIATVNTSGYFNNATAMLRQFDVILVTSDTGGTAKIDVLTVTSATDATTVTTTATEGVTAT